MDGLQMKYFVLKPGGNDGYAKASRMAMRQFANAIIGENPELASQLIDWADREAAEKYAASLEKPITHLK